jgi:hypothetical protein
MECRITFTGRGDVMVGLHDVASTGMAAKLQRSCYGFVCCSSLERLVTIDQLRVGVGNVVCVKPSRGTVNQ